LRIAVASGHGIGQSALIAWIILYAMSTMTDTRGIVTANTASQLSSKTWAELAKWHRLCLTGRWFTLTATAIYSADPERELTWRFDAIPWSAQRPQAFAGLHNKGKRAVVLFDEASTIDSVIWETAEGALTDRTAPKRDEYLRSAPYTAGRFLAGGGRLSMTMTPSFARTTNRLVWG
jgi:hypothetical protein